MILSEMPIRTAITAFFLAILLTFTSATSLARTADAIKYSSSGQTLAANSGVAMLGATPHQIQDALGLLNSDVVSISTRTSDTAGFGVFSTAATSFPTQGPSYFVMSSGATADALTANSSASTSTVLNGLKTSQGNDMVQTVLVLQPPANATCLAFDFAFYSEEFPEFVGSRYNDAFIAEVGESSFQIGGNNLVIAPNNFAFDTAGNVVSVNTVFDVAPSNAVGTTYDAGTPLLTAKTPLSGTGELITVTLSVMDLGDSIYDSTVFIDNFRWLFGVSGGGCGPGADTDTDRDGLLDSWETNGIDVVDRDGTVRHLDLPGMGADPLHKDIFVEIDYMVKEDGADAHNHIPKPEALQTVINAFNSAPVSNPDGNDGIHIHIDAGSDTIMNPVTNETWGTTRSQADVLEHTNNLGTCTTLPSPAYNWGAFDQIKESPVPDGSRLHFSTERRAVFHYNIWGHLLCPELTDRSGISRDHPASDFLVTLGGWGVGSVNEQEGTLMHELGHNLSLEHGGEDSIDRKPNYISIMNRTFQMVGVRFQGRDGTYDYSRFLLPELKEEHLNETVGLSGITTEQYGTRYYCGATQHTEDDINGAINWDCSVASDGTPSFERDVPASINLDSVLDTLTSSIDWDRLVFNGGAIGRLGEKIELPIVVQDPNGSLLDITVAEDASTPKDIAVSMTGPFKALVAPAQTRIYTYTVTNTGDHLEIFNINAIATQNWANLSGLPMRVTLDPGMSTVINIYVTVPAETTVESSDLLSVTARSTMNPAMTDAVETTTVVGIPTTKDQCKKNGWKVFGFVNQGQCIKFFNTGK